MAKPDPRDYVLVPLDKSYGDDEEESEPMFRSAIPDPNADAQPIRGIVGFGLGYALGRVNENRRHPWGYGRRWGHRRPYSGYRRPYRGHRRF